MDRSSHEFRNDHGTPTAVTSNGRISRFGATLFVLVAMMLLATSLLQAAPAQHGVTVRGSSANTNSR